MGMQCAALPAVRALCRVPPGGRVHLAALLESLSFAKCAKDKAEIFSLFFFFFKLLRVSLLKCVHA